MNESWKHFERVVAAIHMAKDSGASVTWNEDIDGRQFDVAIRFKFQFYDFLTLMECKNFKRRVPVEKVEAFATKSKSAKADKAVMVSATGFQEGCHKVARENKIELYTLKEAKKMPHDLLTGEVYSSLQISPLGFRKTGTNEIIGFTEDSNKIDYEVANTKLTGYGNLSIGDLLRPFAQQLVPFEIPGVPRFGPPFKTATNEPQLMEMTLMLNTRVKFPHLDEEIPVTEFLFFYWMEEVHLMKDIGFDPTIFTNLGSELHYRNELTQEVTTLNPDDLNLGFDTKIEPGKFYRQHRFKFSYYCESVEGEQMTMVLVESYQHGMLFQASLTGRLCDSKYYFEITDQKEIERLRPNYRTKV